MNRRPDNPYALVASPLLVGAVTVLVTVIGVFLSYNANVGLPFVPVYKVDVTVPDAAGLVRGNEVRIGGKRVGVVRKIEAVPGSAGKPVGRLALQLEVTVKPLRDDTTLIVRPRSPLGLKYLELTPGKKGKPLPDGGKLGIAAAGTPVELTDVLNSLDAPARTSLRRVLVDLGDGLTGRGADFNAATVVAPELFGRLRSVAANLAAPDTRLSRLLHAADATLAELDPVTSELGSMISDSATTAAAFSAARPELGQVVEELPPTQDAGIRALRAARPVLDDARGLVGDLNAGSRYLVPAAEGLDRALDRGVPALRKTVGLAGRLEDTLEAVRSLSADPATSRTLDRLLSTLATATPLVEFLAPLQTKCNYIGLWMRNVDSTVSEGDAGGTWFRTLVVGDTQSFRASAKPAPTLHVNPYPSTAAPGQDGECEAGNEPYLDGQQLSNLPGNQGTQTDKTEPPAEVRGK